MADVTKLYKRPKRLKIELKTLLDENWGGICLYGSLAFRCFRREVSNVDYLLVVRPPPTSEVKRNWMDTALEFDEI